jgi:hypothetical protein
LFAARARNGRAQEFAAPIRRDGLAPLPGRGRTIDSTADLEDD